MTDLVANGQPRLGPFALMRVEGQAGMGVVWRGIHCEQQVPVAIKFLTQEGSTDPLYLACLRNEVPTPQGPLAIVPVCRTTIVAGCGTRPLHPYKQFLPFPSHAG